jgi:PAS domain S-box-containing protein
MSEAVRAGGSGLRVLLLEDSRFDAELLREYLLRSHPHAQMHVVSDEDAFSGALQAGGWGVILSDYEIPGFGGAQALLMAQERAAHIPFIFVSGVIGEDNAVEMLKRGATDYVSKGRLSRLPVVLERALREKADREGRDLAEARLREADAIYARVVEALREYAVILLDPEGHVRSCNGAARAIFGFTAQEIVGQPADVLFTPEDRASGVFVQEMKAALSGGKANDDRWMMRSDGVRLWAEGVLTPLFSDGRHTGFCKIVRDATQQHRDAEALRMAKEQAERANRAKDRFLAVLSHELRTPLAPIVTAAHLLERSASVPEAHRNLLPMIQRNVALEARLIDDLLDLTAISAGKISLKTGPVDMHQVIGRVVDMLREQARDAELTLALDLRAPNATVVADEARMQQVVWNILRNAIKFTPPGGLVTLRTEGVQGRFVMHCMDTGLGIEAGALARIFSPFEQADREVSRRLGGLGLGLAIARGLVTEHQGELTADSDGPGKGATFTLSLRGVEAAEGDAAAHAAESTLPQAEAGCELLLVEDNVDAAEAMMQLLEMFGYRVTHAATCAEALRLSRERRFDIVLTDVGLPDGSGLEVGRTLSGELPVIALSGYGADSDIETSARAGFAAHLIKPADPEAVHEALQKALADRRSMAAERRGA